MMCDFSLEQLAIIAIALDEEEEERKQQIRSRKSEEEFHTRIQSFLTTLNNNKINNRKEEEAKPAATLSVPASCYQNRTTRMRYNTCAVADCKSVNRKSIAKLPWIAVRGWAVFPHKKEQARRRLWEERCSRETTWRATPFSKICSLHFVNWGENGPSSTHPDPELFAYNGWGKKHVSRPSRPTNTYQLNRSQESGNHEPGGSLHNEETGSSHPSTMSRNVVFNMTSTEVQDWSEVELSDSQPSSDMPFCLTDAVDDDVHDFPPSHDHTYTITSQVATDLRDTGVQTPNQSQQQQSKDSQSETTILPEDDAANHMYMMMREKVNLNEGVPQKFEGQGTLKPVNKNPMARKRTTQEILEDKENNSADESDVGNVTFKMDHIEVKEELLEEDIIEIKEEPLEDTEVKQEAAETEELEGSGRRGEKRTLSRSCSPEAAPDAKKQRPEVEEMRIEDEPAFDKTEVALDWYNSALTKNTNCRPITMSTIVKKRKVDLECRAFNPAWEKYFFTECLGRAQCLICLKTVAVLKEYNVRRHWESEHKASRYASMSAAERKEAIVKLSSNLQKITSFLGELTAEADKVTRVSYEVSRLLARQMKPFTDGDFIKECIMVVMDSLCPEKRSAFKSVSLSPHTVCRCIEEMSDSVNYLLKTCCSNFDVFSLALGESTDMKDTTQLAIFIRGVTAALEVNEELLQVVPLYATTTGQDIFNAVLQCVKQHSLDLSRLVCITTDSAPAMTGEEGAASLLVRHCEAAGHTQPIHKMHYIIHQESLCSKSANLADVMAVVVKVVNSILNHHQFQALTDEVNAHYGDLLSLCEVSWLGHRAVLSCVCDLQQEIAMFLRQKNLPGADHFSNPRWLAGLALLTDITTHLNDLNEKLQFKNILVTDMYSYITAFEVKLRLWEAQLAAGQFRHFPHIADCAPDDVDLNTCVGVVTSLREEFASRFIGVRPLALCFKLLTSPFHFPVDEAPAHLQMELMELQCNDKLRAKYRAACPLSFFRDLILPSNEFPNYIEHVKRIVAMFGSIYCCEQLFSKVKYAKSHIHSQLSGRHLNDILLLSTSSINPVIPSS